MKIVWLLFRSNTRKTTVIVLLGLLSGAASTALIAAANNSLYSGAAAKHARWLLALAFTLAVVIKVGRASLRGLLLGRSLQDITLTHVRGSLPKSCGNAAARSSKKSAGRAS
jgi:ABC-type siderophore export system fused ATPase/permease subunit